MRVVVLCVWFLGYTNGADRDDENIAVAVSAIALVSCALNLVIVVENITIPNRVMHHLMRCRDEIVTVCHHDTCPLYIAAAIWPSARPPNALNRVSTPQLVPNPGTPNASHTTVGNTLFSPAMLMSL